MFVVKNNEWTVSKCKLCTEQYRCFFLFLVPPVTVWPYQRTSTRLLNNHVSGDSKWSVMIAVLNRLNWVEVLFPCVNLDYLNLTWQLRQAPTGSRGPDPLNLHQDDSWDSRISGAIEIVCIVINLSHVLSFYLTDCAWLMCLVCVRIIRPTLTVYDWVFVAIFSCIFTAFVFSQS